MFLGGLLPAALIKWPYGLVRQHYNVCVMGFFRLFSLFS